ncbi:MAG: TonB-dependent receptor [Vicinamibacteria bacterium]|nr:TonB-dependent receptor [Vicinamibacteria bacterium]
MTKRSLLAAALLGAALLVLPAAETLAQTTPTGIITGHVTDPQGGLLPGVLVTASSSSLQGTRTAISSKNGDYIVPFLPAGDYTVTFELAGFSTASQKVRVQLAESVPLDAQLSVGGVTEAVTVTAEAPSDFTQGATAAASYKAEQLDKLPVGRDVRGAVLLAPGTTSTGPGGNITFSGAMSFEGLFLMNGVVLNETLRGQGSLVFIEDAIEETKTSTAAISAEYGRFSGGVANIITKSGGNDFSGSFRTTLDSDNWRTLSPFEKDLSEDPRVSTIVPTYEATLGGPIMKDKLWFFGAGKFVENEDSATTVFTNIAYPNLVKDQRAEGKLTYALSSKHTLKGSITKRWRDETNNTFGNVMDRASFYDSSQPERLLSVHYAGIMKPNFFVEAQFSERKLSFVGSGARFTDLIKGTMIQDRSRGSARWNSPTFCAVCGLSPEDIAAGKLNEEGRNNRNVILKGSYFLSTSNTGSHNIVFGGDAFEDSRKNNNWQSGSEFRLLANNTIIRGENLFPVVIPGTSNTQSTAAYILWTPIFEATQGSKLRTYSAFVNDAWRLSNNWSFNVGLRFDRTDEKDQQRNQLAKDQAFSPRLSSSFDVKGDGRFVLNAGFARYVIPVTSGIADLGSGAGRSASFQYVYRGPAINADLNTPNPVSAADALAQVFAWFNANGGTDRPLRSNPSYPGVNRKVSDTITTPTTWEYSLGFAGKLGSKGSYRVDGVYRDYNDFYTDEILPGRTVADPAGRTFDFASVVNTNDLERTYKALIVQGQYRATSKVRLGGNYTLSNSHGNFNGETSGSGPVADDFLTYVEYKNASWNTPTGDLSIDQRHKLRVWANFEKSLGGAGRLDIGLLERYNSGSPYSSNGTVDSRPYVTNPGYLSPPSSVTYYYGGRGNFKTDAVAATDLSVNYYLPVKRLQRGQVFLRIVVNNLFDQSAQDGIGNSTVFSATNQNTARSLVAFNPFTETPVAGRNFELGPDFGKAISASDYQAPRGYYFSMGFRF